MLVLNRVAPSDAPVNASGAAPSEVPNKAGTSALHPKATSLEPGDTVVVVKLGFAHKGQRAVVSSVGGGDAKVRASWDGHVHSFDLAELKKVSSQSGTAAGHLTRGGSFSAQTAQTTAVAKKQSRAAQLEMEQSLRIHTSRNQPSAFMMHPGSVFATNWTIASLVLVLYISVSVPMFLCFQLRLPPPYAAIEIFIDLFFVADVAVNFHTGFQPSADRPDLVVMDRAVVARAYARSWLALDVVSGVPVATLKVGYRDALCVCVFNSLPSAFMGDFHHRDFLQGAHPGHRALELHGYDGQDAQAGPLSAPRQAGQGEHHRAQAG